MRATAPLVLLFAVGCTEVPERGPLPDWSEGMEGSSGAPTDPGTGGEPTPPGGGGGAMFLDLPDELPFTARLSAAGGGDCTVGGGTPGDRAEVDCVLDVAELDLAANELTFDLLVTDNSCEFVAWHHYMYLAWPAGDGPTEVTYDIDAQGFYSNEVNSINGVPTCEYDHSRLHPAFPNCCTGNYTVTAQYIDQQQVVVSDTQFWGGNLAACYSGAAYVDKEAVFTPDGWPLGKIVDVNGEAYAKRMAFETLVDKFYSNVPLANWYDPADHDGVMPAGLAADLANPHYTFQCLDSAEEELAVIRLQVREWNLVSEFEDEGDPDTTGALANGDPIDDRHDWAAATPGSVDYVMYAE